MTPLCIPMVLALDVPREVQDQQLQIYLAALAECGFKPEPFWDGRQYAHSVAVPEPYHSRAREIAFRALGIPYEWTTYEAEGHRIP